MSLIEGIGDDLLYAVGFLGFLGIISLAWFSTRVNQIPFPSTLFIIERRTRRRNGTSKFTECCSIESSVRISEEETERSSVSPTPSHEATPPIRQDPLTEHESDVE